MKLVWIFFIVCLLWVFTIVGNCESQYVDPYRIKKKVEKYREKFKKEMDKVDMTTTTPTTIRTQREIMEQIKEFNRQRGYDLDDPDNDNNNDDEY